MARIHSLEDDITFERVRHLPKRTRVCSIHRQLSWACTKEVQIYEKDAKVTTSGLERSKTAMKGRFRELRTLQRKLMFNKTMPSNRRASCPAVLMSENKLANLRLAAINAQSETEVGHHVTDKDDVTESTSKVNKSFPRSVSINVPFKDVKDNEQKVETGELSANYVDDKTDITKSVLQRRKTMPTL